MKTLIASLTLATFPMVASKPAQLSDSDLGYDRNES